MVIDHQNISTVDNRTCSRWLFTVETIEIHYRNVHFSHLLLHFGVFYVLYISLMYIFLIFNVDIG